MLLPMRCLFGEENFPCFKTLHFKTHPVSIAKKNLTLGYLAGNQTSESS